MTTHHTHLCLVSAQATPNLLPVLDEAWRPVRVVLAASGPMQANAKAISDVLKTKVPGLRVDLLNLPNAYDYGALSDTFLDFLAEHPGDDIALNVTGGTKLMAVAAQEVFRAEGKPVFYVNVETDEVIVIGGSRASQPLQPKLRVPELLRAHGYSVTAHGTPSVTREQRDLTAKLIDHVESAGRALGQLNALASEARDRPPFKVDLTPAQLDSRQLDMVLNLLKDAGLIKRGAHSITFVNEDARFFANGGWLEVHAFELLQSLRGQMGGSANLAGLSDVVMGLRVGFDDGRARDRDKNEIDVAFLYRNTLHLIECKTANLAQAGTSGDDKATEAIYKMESLLKLGGLRTKGMILDYRGQLNASPANLERAKQAHIEIVAGRQLKDLKGHIQRAWLSR
jgi:Domain of unknown function (DUF1887)